MKNILIVDDDRVTLTMLENTLKRDIKNINILQASSYKEALKHILNNNITIHVAILDLHLPDVKDGDLVDYAVKKNIPSIVLSGMLNETFKQTILEKDIIDYIPKEGVQGINSAVLMAKRVLNNYNTYVLIVDDSATQLSIAKKMLENLKLNILTAKDGIEALDIINNNDKKISLVVTDYNMPNMNGMELTLKIREKYQKDQLGIIVISANDTPEIPTKFIKIGANDFINKPYSQIEVTTRVNSNLEILELFEQTRDMANKDFMTGAYNRRFFFESGQAIFGKAKRDKRDIVVAMFDIDKFKNINDTYGHDVGDVAICEVANILNKHLRSSDLMARFGGEEFCVLLEKISLKDTEQLFEKIRKAFEENIINIDDLSIKFTTSVGICYGLEDDLDKMIKVADDGLYYCKNNGRNQIAVNKHNN
ncbi:MAG: diguanylate cyclase [Campylobacterota bacterium]|nr:diguanylate cyclase [Campylobacterota bacterium]